ncbi:MAG: HD domain-containing protein [Oscillospiraceae bacterium]|nr:HD domain-containing protein [Oscillospiraceae bacterium]
MLIENKILIFDFAWAISGVVDLVSTSLNNHHKRVSYIAGSIAQKMDLPSDEVQDVIMAAILHDIGAFYSEERDIILSFDIGGSDLNRHAYMGYMLLRGFEPLAKAAELIRLHHVDFHKSHSDVPIGSEILHLADRISILLDSSREVLGQVSGIMEYVKKNNTIFHPDALAALDQLAPKEYFWIDASSSLIHSDMAKMAPSCREIVDLETLRDFARIIAEIIDFRCRFTSTHSYGVAAVAKEISLLSGFSERECAMMEIAGFLHDIGKLSAPSSILEKNGALNQEEINVMRKHTYYTYAILNEIRGLENIAEWAAYHHERLDGAGYPFHIHGRDFSKLSRVMAVADIVTALAEDRPYRPGMDRENVKHILLDMVEDNGIDKSVVDVVNENYTRINEVRIEAQQEEKTEYDEFRDLSQS